MLGSLLWSKTINIISSYVYWGIIEKYRHNWVNSTYKYRCTFFLFSLQQEKGQLKYKYQPIDPSSFIRFDLADNNWSPLTAWYVSDVDQPVRCFHCVPSWDHSVYLRFKSIATSWMREYTRTTCFPLKTVESVFAYKTETSLSSNLLQILWYWHLLRDVLKCVLMCFVSISK